MTRRLMVLGGVSLLAVAAVVGFALFIWPTDGQASLGRRITVHQVSHISVLSPEPSAEDRFYMVRMADDADGHPVLRAFYRVTPQSYAGSVSGCTLVWRPDMNFEANGRVYRGVFRDPCSGATFSIDGTHIFGPASGDLVQFPVRLLAHSDDAIVDTRLPQCASSVTPCVRSR